MADEYAAAVRKADRGLAAACHNARSMPATSGSGGFSSLNFSKMSDSALAEAKEQVFAAAAARKLR